MLGVERLKKEGWGDGGIRGWRGGLTQRRVDEKPPGSLLLTTQVKYIIGEMV